MVKCPRCGYDNDSSSTYCENCSYILNGSPTGQKRGGWKMGTAKKIALVIGIVAISLLLFSFIYNANQPSNKDSLNVIEADQNIQQGSSHPYQVKIIYNGTWYSKTGEPSYLKNTSGSGQQVIGVDCASWDEVYASVQKDYSSENLTVQILRNGEVVAANSTATPGGTVTLSYRS